MFTMISFSTGKLRHNQPCCGPCFLFQLLKLKNLWEKFGKTRLVLWWFNRCPRLIPWARYYSNCTLWKGERYTSCTEADSHGLEWCSTLTDVLDNHLTGYWGNCDSLENELAQVTFMSLIYKTMKFNLLLYICFFEYNSYQNSWRVLLQSAFAGKKR